MPIISDKAPEPIDFYPFGYALLDDQLNQRCWYCLATGYQKEEEKPKLLRCAGCQMAYFCDQTCHKRAWIDHRPECNALKNARLNSANGQVQIPDIEVRHLGRIAARHKMIEEGKDTVPEFYLNRQSRRKIMEIWSHDQEIRYDAEALKKFEAIYDRLKKFYAEKHLPPKDVVFQLHCRNYINRHAISDRSYVTEIGKGLYLDLCEYDHSCRPNSIFTCSSFVANLRALGPNVDLTNTKTTSYTYIDLLNNRQQRRALLKGTWYFTCECVRCKDDNDHIVASLTCVKCSQPVSIFSSADSKEPIKCSKCKTKMSGDRMAEGISAMRWIGQVLDDAVLGKHDKPLTFIQDLYNQYSALLPPVNVHHARLVQSLIQHTPATDHARLLELHLEAVVCMRQCYPAAHPALLYHLFSCGHLARTVGDLPLATSFLEEATELFEFVLGADHILTNQTKHELIMTEQEKQGEKGAKVFVDSVD